MDTLIIGQVSGEQVSSAPSTPTTTASGEQASSAPSTQTTIASYYNPEKEINKLYTWLYAIVIAIGIAFFFMLFSFIQDKEVIINYGNLSDKYFDRYIELNNSFNDIKNQSALDNQKIIIIESENKKLLNISDCIKDKKYWQYNQCFK